MPCAGAWYLQQVTLISTASSFSSCFNAVCRGLVPATGTLINLLVRPLRRVSMPCAGAWYLQLRPQTPEARPGRRFQCRVQGLGTCNLGTTMRDVDISPCFNAVCSGLVTVT